MKTQYEKVSLIITIAGLLCVLAGYIVISDISVYTESFEFLRSINLAFPILVILATGGIIGIAASIATIKRNRHQQIVSDTGVLIQYDPQARESFREYMQLKTGSTDYQKNNCPYSAVVHNEPGEALDIVDYMYQKGKNDAEKAK